MQKKYAYLNSTLGLIEIAALNNGIASVFFVEEQNYQTTQDPLLTQAIEQLQQYLAGNRQTFDLPLKPQGTEFQQRVWQALSTIAFGEVKSYQAIAEQVGSPKAMRAVGAANGKNPISIIVPCHRVVGKNGTLTGYSGGLERKAFLLNLETKLKP
ncbi:MAG: methylated-DNA--[protein]-cysteine S-methyltransferase [Thalassotalea sp.]